MSIIQSIALLLLFLSVLLVIIRFILGPGSADRIVAADSLSVLGTVVLVGLAAVLKNSIYLDIALVYSALAFIAIVVLAHIMEQK